MIIYSWNVQTSVHLIKTSQAAISIGRYLWCHKLQAYETDNQEIEIKEGKSAMWIVMFWEESGKEKAKGSHSSVFLEEAFQEWRWKL